MTDVNYITKEDFEKLQAEVRELKTNGRREAAIAIAEAREKGDLSENAEYDAAKDAQGMLELKINELELAIAKSKIIDVSDLDLSKVTVLSKVTIKNIKNGQIMKMHLVAESTSDAKNGKISVSSPVGKGLLGHEVGQVAKIQTPGGIIEFEIMDISI
ncbi:MAG TPA: transcription elongation factor GreA [Saprospiraceae bacterium]|nr:transcription elongation factor GreA [Saprospiraceae bacterium]